MALTQPGDPAGQLERFKHWVAELRARGLGDEANLDRLQGMLAQFSRPALVQDLGRRLIGDFALNLSRRMNAKTPAIEKPPQPALNAGKLFWEFLWDRLRRAFKRFPPN